MKKQFVVIRLIIFWLCCFSTAFGQNIIPYPTTIKPAYCSVDLQRASISIDADSLLGPHLVAILKEEILQPYLQNMHADDKIVVKLVHDPQYKNIEAYQLRVVKGLIEIRGENKGIFYGIQSLRQLVAEGDGQVACQTIIDQPAFGWRGMHLDVSRHFFPVSFIKKYIDILALHKMNTFHWHLTDDQGWRIEIKQYPMLTSIGSERSETMVGKNFDPFLGDGVPHGGYYTQKQIRDVVAYAQARNITIVPEIEMPGHALAALSAYPQFSCTGGPFTPLTKWGISDDVFCSHDSTFHFLFNVLDEVLDLFPSTYIHIGGDEMPKTRWKNCHKCQGVMKHYGLKNEAELQSYFIGRIDSFLTAKGRQTIGWDEILEGGLAPNAAVMSWRGEQGGIAAAKQQHKVVMCPGSHCYFDHYQGDRKTEPLAIGGYTTVKKVFHYQPIPAQLNRSSSKYILGAQGNVWTEYIATPEHLMYMALPRLCALSEVLWTGEERPAYENFVNRLIRHFELLDEMKINYSRALYDINSTTFSSSSGLMARLNNDVNGFDIRYTTNGSAPTFQSSKYNQPILITENLQLQAALFKDDKKVGNIYSQNFSLSKSTAKKLSISPLPDERYNIGGEQTLVDGIIGNQPWTAKEWLGWRTDNIKVKMDLGEKTKTQKIKIAFLDAKESWIHSPETVKLIAIGKGSSPDQKQQQLFEVHNQFYELQLDEEIQSLELEIIPMKAVPANYPGSGEMPWTFCSEIIIE